MLNPEFKLLQQICEESGSNKKQALLKQGATENLKRFLLYSYDRFKTYRIKQIDLPEKYNAVAPDLFSEFFALCDTLASHSMGTSDAKGAIRAFLAKSTPESSAWFHKALLRDLDIGMDEKSINKVFPGLLPTFSVQLAYPVDERWEKLKYPLIGEIKADGVRCLALSDGSTKFYSREGREFTNLQWLGRQVASLWPGQKFVLDGEIDSIKFNPLNKTAVKNKDGNWKFYQSLSMLKTEGTPQAEMEEYLVYRVWDVIPLDLFLAQGKSEVLSKRKVQLASMFARVDGKVIPNVTLMDNVLLHSSADVWSYFRANRENGEEGIMLKNPDKPYEFKRSDAVLKMKEFNTYDLWVEDVQEGEGKYAGSTGALICRNETLSAKVGTGFDDDTRLELFVEHLGGRLRGCWVEVSSQEVTADGSLRFPVFVRMRPDKERKQL